VEKTGLPQLGQFMGFCPYGWMLVASIGFFEGITPQSARLKVMISA